MICDSSEGDQEIDSSPSGEPKSDETPIGGAKPLLSQASWDDSLHRLDCHFASAEDRNLQSSSRRDRRKQFDVTTPTLVDEEDFLDDSHWKTEASPLAVGSEPMQIQDAGTGTGSIIIEKERCQTPATHAYNDISDEQLRRTPGAESMQQTTLRNLSAARKQDPGLACNFALADQVAQTGEISDAVSGSSWRALEVSMTSISAQVESNAQSQGALPCDRRQGTFSPVLLRLTEDIGNLLYEDEDDEYAVDIPDVIRAETDRPGDGRQPGDSAGGLAIDTNADFVRKTTASGDILPSSKGRRRSGDILQSEQNQPQLQLQQTMTQQPIARKRVNEVFMFGSTHQNESHQPSQFLHFGGAFAPLVKSGALALRSFEFQSSQAHDITRQEITRQGTFISPTCHEGSSTSGNHQQVTQEEIQQFYLHSGSAITAAVEDHLTSSPSHESFPANLRETPIDAYFQSHRSSPASSSATSFSHSDMMATAQEYVPMAVPHMTPRYSPPTWSLHPLTSSFPTPRPYTSAPGDTQTWQSSPSALNRAYSLNYGDFGSAMMPSSQTSNFQQWDSRHYLSCGQASQFSHAAPIATYQRRASAQDGRSAWRKRDTKKSKRGKKKPSKDSSQCRQLSIKTTQRIRKDNDTHGQDAAGNAINEIVEDTEPASGRVNDPKRTELDESPGVRLVFKNFYKLYRTEEQKGVQYAEEFAKNALLNEALPAAIHWRVFIELADLARRTNRFADARQYYKKVCILQPYASQGWVEYSKLEEECGNMNRVTNILYVGLEYCEYNENLLIRAIKHLEKMGKHGSVRALLAKLKNVEIDKIWRTLLEGALFEARVGNFTVARRAFKYVLHFVPWYGPLYVEYYRLERDHGHTMDALGVVERGLAQIPRYGPLWFSALRVCEEIDHTDMKYDLPRVTSVLQRASVHVGKEIIWKVYLEAAFSFERAAAKESERTGHPINTFLSVARYYFALTIYACRLNLRWKVWLASARMELCAGNVSTALRLFRRAHEVAPEKVRSLTLLDYARFYEFTGHRDLARAILCKARVEYRQDWKVWLESVLLEVRESNINRAFELCRAGLEVHSGTGRLWSAFVQLSRFTSGAEAQFAALRQALNAVPKSGEVWCEGARIHLNPFSDVFDIQRARRHLSFAERFTPQYGDSFLESIRLELIKDWLIPIADFVWNQTKTSFISKPDEDQVLSLTKYITDVSLALSIACRQEEYGSCLNYHEIIEQVGKLVSTMPFPDKVNLSRIILACSNADPNYGPLWFYCRRFPNDSPRKVIERAKATMLGEIKTFAHLYLAAQIRRLAITSTVNFQSPTVSQNGLENADSYATEWEERQDALLRSYPSLREMYEHVDAKTGLALLPGALDGFDFATGLIEYNRQCPLDRMSPSDRRQSIFATDALFP